MQVRVIKRRDMYFKWIVGQTFNVIQETDDGKGYYLELPVGACRAEKEECEVVS